MNLQEEVIKIKSMMGVIKEDEYIPDRPNKYLSDRYYDGTNNNTHDDGFDEPEQDDSKWKTSDDLEDDKESHNDVKSKVENFRERVRDSIIDNDGNNVEVTYFGTQPVKIIGRNGKTYMAPADLVNVTVVLDQGDEDEYISFVLLTNIFTKIKWDESIRRYTVMRPVNMKYHKNGEETPVGKINGEYLFYDTIKEWGKLRSKVVGALKGEKKI